jgi:hypothetical protein
MGRRKDTKKGTELNFEEYKPTGQHRTIWFSHVLGNIQRR